MNRKDENKEKRGRDGQIKKYPYSLSHDEFKNFILSHITHGKTDALMKVLLSCFETSILNGTKLAKIGKVATTFW